ncbi:inositol monophosphatase family protein [Micromonospora sp. WMMC250]|uniref:inositol monophosphatase family protein n=1 Tax=Micromonospora sp. WMMC250 TaxID=3014781 RepID=UPI0022B62438|nr:inositol monophosphatase family protein [Micromonospora sp. WMMC250]MCZ7379178.1 inositol monophosphatase family protein [Micromonospora sp. WMMC250]
MSNFAHLLPLANEAVDLAHHLMRTLRPGTLTSKGDRDMASEVDYAIEQQVRELLAAKAPDIGFLGEEHGLSGDATELMWALDPVDGTVNFVHGSPLCAISLGLIHKKTSVLGIIDLPFLGTRYHAAEGSGAFANGERIHCSQAQDLRNSVVAIGDYAVGTDATVKNVQRLGITHQLVENVQRIRMHGSAAIDLAWLAHGKIDAFIMLNNKPWDTAAGVVIAKESGVQLVDVDGTPHSADSTATVGGNDQVLPLVLALVQQALSSPQAHMVAGRPGD